MEMLQLISLPEIVYRVAWDRALDKRAWQSSAQGLVYYTLHVAV